MAGNESPRLVWILIQLAQNWFISKNRYERYGKRQRRAGDSAELDDSEGEALWAAYHLHPFPGFVRFVDHRIGFGQDAIRDAAHKEFNGERELIAALNALDEKGITAELFENLRNECPDIVQRLFPNQNAGTATKGAEPSALADWLDQAGKVFGLARTLAGEFKQNFDSQGPVFMIGDESPRQRHRGKIDEFIAATLDLGDAVKNPPVGFVAVADQIRKAGQIGEQLANTNSGNILGLFPDLNTVAEYGYEAVNSARNATRPDDPFAVFDEPKVSETSAVAEAIAIVPTLEEIRAKIQSTREQARHPNASHNPDRIAADAYNDFAVIVRMLDKCGVASPPLPDHRLHPLQTMAYVLQKLDDAELAVNRAAAAIEQSARDFVADKLGHIGPTLDAVAAKILNPPDFSDAFAEVAELVSRPDDELAAPKTNAKPKRRGRKKADYATVQREAQLAADWERARDAGTYKADFAKQKRLKVKDLDALLDRVAWRQRASE